jgi:hypothetical protein
MPDREKKRSERHGPSTETDDSGIEGAIFDDGDTDQQDDAADVRDLDAAARGEGGVSSRSSEQQGSGGRVQGSENDSGEETPPETRPS